MKLVIVILLIACGYAAKLDRTYLPPSSASTAGGSPGALNAPAGPGSPVFGQPAGTTGFGQQARGPGSSSSFGQLTSGSAFGAQPSGSNGLTAPSSQFGQPGSPAGSLDSGFSQSAQSFGGQGDQSYQRNQPQRAQASAEQNAEILRYDNQNDGETFSYAFETSNGIAAEESGVATNGVRAQGGYSYSGDDGQAYRVTYTADENGYQPQGDHLPTPHPIPEEIQKSIEVNAQAAAAGTQEGAYNPNEDNISSAPQKYSSNAPNSYGQASSGSFSQASGNFPNQLYGASNDGNSATGAQNFQPQGYSQQYSADNAGDSFSGSSNSFNKPQAPSQTYNSPSTGASALGSSSASQAKPNSFGQPQQYSALSRPGSSGSLNGLAPSGPALNKFQPSGPSTQPRPSQYQVPSQSAFPSVGRPQEPQGDSGYQYNRPQVPSLGQSSNGRSPSQGTGGPYRPQNGAAQPSGQGSFSNSNSAGYTPGPAQGSFGSSSTVGSQGSFGPTSGPQGSFARPTSNIAGYPSGLAQGPFSASTSTSSQNSFGLASSSNGGAFGLSGSKGPASSDLSTSSAGQGSFGPAAGSKSPSSFGLLTGANAPSSFGNSAGTNSFVRPQGSVLGNGNQGGMSEPGYSYNRPGSQSGSVSQQPQGSYNPSASGSGQTFGGPRQPPSFSEEEGYKY